MSEAVEFAARDGYRLAGTLYRAPRGADHAATINAAAGVPQAFYAKFAAYLAERGIHVLSYDYRGIGGSRPVSIRGMRAGMSDWIGLDAPAALDHLAGLVPEARLMAIGHSIGGHSFGFSARFATHGGRLAAALSVGSQSGYWAHWSGAGKLGMWLLMHAGIPLTARIAGYIPSSLFGMGEDLPAGIATEWAGWCRQPGYLPAALSAQETYARYTGPLRACWIADDGYAPLRAVEAYLGFYAGAATELKRIDPAHFGGQKIGHFGFFRERFRDTLWRDAADWLLAR